MDSKSLQTFLFLYSVLFEFIFFCIFPCFVLFFILLTVFPMSLLSLFLSFSFVMHSALWLHVCEKHFIFASWWSVQNHMSVIFTFSAALILLNLCVGAWCASPDPTVTEKCQDKLVRVVCNAVWRFLREVFFHFYVSFAEINTQIQRSLWNHSETHLMRWTGYCTPLYYFLSVPEK